MASKAILALTNGHSMPVMQMPQGQKEWLIDVCVKGKCVYKQLNPSQVHYIRCRYSSPLSKFPSCSKTGSRQTIRSEQKPYPQKAQRQRGRESTHCSTCATGNSCHSICYCPGITSAHRHTSRSFTQGNVNDKQSLPSPHKVWWHHADTFHSRHNFLQSNFKCCPHAVKQLCEIS